jgi:hypothetical protein
MDVIWAVGISTALRWISSLIATTEAEGGRAAERLTVY